MKFLFLFLALSMSNVFAVTCDLSVTVSDTVHTYEEVLGYGSHKGRNGTALGNARAKAIKDCTEKGGENCNYYAAATTCRENYAWEDFGTSKCSAVARGMKITGTIKLSGEEYAKAKKAEVCKKLSICENQIFNDRNSGVNDLEKIEFLIKRNKCDEV